MTSSCECGCGERTKATFRPGHDQRLRTNLENRMGGLLPLRTLVEAAEAFAAGELASEVFEVRIRAIMAAASD